jgi:hypothetical protein
MRVAFLCCVLALGACVRDQPRPIIVEGKIQSIDLASGRAPIITLDIIELIDVQCRFPLNRVAELSKLQPGQSIRVRGTVVPEFGRVVLEDSAIEFAGRKPGQEEEDDDD